MTLYPKLIMDALATVTYAGTKKNLVESGMVADTPTVSAPATEGEPWKVKVILEFPRDTDPFLKSTVKAAEAAIKYHCGKSGEPGNPEAIDVEIITEFKSARRPSRSVPRYKASTCPSPSPVLATMLSRNVPHSKVSNYLSP